MTRLGSALIAALLLVILGEAFWFVREKSQLEERAMPFSDRVLGRSNLSTPHVRPTAAPTSNPGPLAPINNRPVPAVIDPGVRIQQDDLLKLMESGLLANVDWLGLRRDRDPGKIVTAVASFLDLSADETAALRATVETGQHTVEAEVIAATSVIRRSTDEVIVNVRDSSEAKIAAIRMQDAIKEQLGETRFRIYEHIGAKRAIEGRLAGRGENAVQLAIRRTYDEKKGAYSYFVDSLAPGGGGGGFGGPRESLTSNLGAIAAAVPGDF